MKLRHRTRLIPDKQIIYVGLSQSTGWQYAGYKCKCPKPLMNADFLESYCLSRGIAYIVDKASINLEKYKIKLTGYWDEYECCPEDFPKRVEQLIDDDGIWIDFYVGIMKHAANDLLDLRHKSPRSKEENEDLAACEDLLDSGTGQFVMKALEVEARLKKDPKYRHMKPEKQKEILWRTVNAMGNHDTDR